MDKNACLRPLLHSRRTWCLRPFLAIWLSARCFNAAERKAGISRKSSATFFTFYFTIEVIKCHLQGKSCCYNPYVVHSFFGRMGLDEGDSFQLDPLAALFYPAAYSFTSIFLHRNLSSILFIGLILSPAEIQEHCLVPAGSRRDWAHAVQKGEWFIVVWIYYQLFPFTSLLRTIVLEQHKLLLADLCIFVPTPSVRSHRYLLTLPFCTVVMSAIFKHKYKKQQWCAESCIPTGLALQLYKANPGVVQWQCYSAGWPVYSTWVFFWWG